MTEKTIAAEDRYPFQSADSFPNFLHNRKLAVNMQQCDLPFRHVFNSMGFSTAQILTAKGEYYVGPKKYVTFENDQGTSARFEARHFLVLEM
ncbi:MAG: hypothetical protein DI551_11100 [Micavibrio aeruginosavorus]|uniref:Uncharacterized protein n=1 Tax=Micavibrio aeruginosavorus TaxID=349221 RepID=A0A2W5PHA5_9BACT|nr:MAG: hypothetical protein DI551_11100 [Micavibrio aeruginosavorus]